MLTEAYYKVWMVGGKSKAYSKISQIAEDFCRPDFDQMITSISVVFGAVVVGCLEVQAVADELFSNF